MSESAVPIEPATTGLLATGRLAFDNFAWPEAFDLLSMGVSARVMVSAVTWA
jgi:hypothetical protein